MDYISHSYNVLSRGEESHDKDCLINGPRRVDLLQRRVVKQGKSLRGCFVVLSALLLPSSAVSPWGAPVGLVGHTLLSVKRK